MAILAAPSSVNAFGIVDSISTQVHNNLILVLLFMSGLKSIKNKNKKFWHFGSCKAALSIVETVTELFQYLDSLYQDAKRSTYAVLHPLNRSYIYSNTIPKGEAKDFICLETLATK
jgi:hypothetical protein